MGTWGDRPPPPEEAPLAEDDPRLVELELAAIDRVLDAAHAETHFLGRRRKLLEAARKLLLDATAALPLDPEAASARAQHIADEIVLANRLQAAGLAPEVALPHQALSAMARGERDKLHAALRATLALSGAEGDVAIAARAGEALRRLERGALPLSRDASTERSAVELLGDAPVQAIREAYDAARREHAFRKSAPRPDDDPDTHDEREDLWDRYLDDAALAATLSAAVSVDGCFEVGGTLAPVRVDEETKVLRVVSHPTPDMVLVPARDATDLASAVVTDPRSVVLDLAQGRLLARKFVRTETTRTPRTKLTSEVRIYLLDGSDSMLLGQGRAAGARARMRDALLLAELSTLYRRAATRGQTTRVVLFYRYFTKFLGPVTRVDTAAEALQAMAEVVSTPRHGGTDIQAALLASFEQIREARASDPDLSRAQIVLVTDGAAWIDERAVQQAREREGDFPIGVSVVALGEENPVLRRLAARQRARGEPTFYHHLPDLDLAAIVEGRRASGAAVHSPPAPATPSSLAADLGSLVDEIEALTRARASGAPPHAAAPTGAGTADAASLAAVGLPAPTETEGDRAHREARARDDRALATRFDVWFPPAAPDAPPETAPSEARDADDDDATADAEAVLVVLATLADVLGDLAGTGVERRADAIELLERLLPDARLSPARYRAVVAAPTAPVAAALATVRRLAGAPQAGAT